MNINPISFKGVTKITGNRPLASANRISDIINHNENCKTETEKKIAKRFSCKETRCEATSITFNQGKSAYVVTGKECQQLKELSNYMDSYVETASKVYGKGSDMAKIIAECEMDRFYDLAKIIVIDQEDATLDINYDDSTNKINSLNLIL